VLIELSTHWLSRNELLENINNFIKDADLCVDLILVEGIRDVEALRALGYKNKIEVCSHIGASYHDLVLRIAREGKKVLILTDFDEKGNNIADRISALLESEEIRVKRELRNKFSQMMGKLGVKTIESLDDIMEKELIKRNKFTKNGTLL
jgi:5S rRNA maturation endonuclease (ribonuclease M5)